MFLNSILVVITDLAAGLLGNASFRRHFHLLLSALLLFGPLLSLWVSHYSVFAKRTHFLYRVFLRSGWGWTCIFVGSFVFVLSFSVRRSLTLSLRHLSRLAVAGGLWLSFRKLLCLLENATGSCYEPLSSTLELASGTNGDQPLLLLREAEETAVFGPYLSLGGPSGAPLRILFLFCVLLLSLWVFLLLCLLAYFPQFPTQLLGGALGCLSWRALYQGWYRLGPCWYCPGRPGVGLLSTQSKQEETSESLCESNAEEIN